jgi:hypothetical protein
MNDYERLELIHCLLQEFCNLQPLGGGVDQDLKNELFTHVEVLREKAVDAPWNNKESNRYE